MLANELAYDDEEKLHEQLATFRKAFDGLKPKHVMWAIRASLTGLTQGADISAVIMLLGKDKIKTRVQKAITKKN